MFTMMQLSNKKKPQIFQKQTASYLVNSTVVREY